MRGLGKWVPGRWFSARRSLFHFATTLVAVAAVAAGRQCGYCGDKETTVAMGGTDFELSDAVLGLSQIFPDVPFAHLQHVLDISGNNVDDALDQMMNYGLIKDDLDDIIKEKREVQEQEVQFKRTSEWTTIHEQECEKSDNIMEKKKNKSRRDSNTNRSKQKDKTKSVTKTQEERLLEEQIEAMKTEVLVEKWKLQDSIAEILDITDANYDLLEWYLDQNKCKKLQTVTDIMLNFNPDLPLSKQTRDTLQTVSTTEIIVKNSNFAKSTIAMSDVLKLDMKTVYVSEDERLWKQLEETVKLTPGFNAPKKFLQVAWNWFDKDIPKTLNLLLDLNEEFEPHEAMITKQMEKKVESLYKLNDIRISNDDPPDNTDYNEMDKFGRLIKNNDYNNENINPSVSLSNLQKRSKNLKNVRDGTSDKLLKAYYSSSIAETSQDIRDHHDETQFVDVRGRIREAKRTSNIDFHNLSVKNAMYALEEILSYWWDEELKQRELHSSNFRMTSALHSQPLVIVTGRGLHSSGSVPKIKNSTIGYLTANGYKFEEHMSRITVIGKKR